MEATPPKQASAKRTWTIVAVIVVVAVAFLVSFGVGMYFVVSGMLKDSDAYRLGIQTMEANARVMEILGPPVTTGFPSGNVRTSNADGEAALAIPVQGQKARGTLYVEATKKMGIWKTDRLQLEVEGRAERIDLIGGGTAI